VTGIVPVLTTVTGTAPSGASAASVLIQAGGTPPSSITFYGAAP
jgi:hypothetical protein